MLRNSPIRIFPSGRSYFFIFEFISCNFNYKKQSLSLIKNTSRLKAYLVCSANALSRLLCFAPATYFLFPNLFLVILNKRRRLQSAKRALPVWGKQLFQGLFSLVQRNSCLFIYFNLQKIVDFLQVCRLYRQTKNYFKFLNQSCQNIPKQKEI